VEYVELLSFPAATAVPKYRPDCAAAAPSDPAAAACAPGLETPVRARTTAPVRPVALARVLRNLGSPLSQNTMDHPPWMGK
jgi:hypothetical protein